MVGISSPASGQITRLVAGHLGLEGVRRAVSDPFSYGLGSLLDQCLPGRSGLVTPSLLRSKYKPGHKLTAYYTLDAGQNRSAPRHLAVTWSMVPADVGGASPLEREAEARGLVEPFARLVAASPDGCLTLMIAPIDPAFPRLVRLHEPGHVAATATILAGRPAPGGREDHPEVHTEVHSIRYRPGQRHVLRVATAETSGGAGEGSPASGGYFVKVYRDTTGERAIAVATVLDTMLTEAVPGVRPARPVGYVEADQAAWWAAAEGEPLWRWLAGPRAPGLLRRIGQALRVMHRTGPVPVDAAQAGAASACPPVPAYDVAAELAATTRAAEHIQHLLPEVGTRMRDVLSQVGDGLASRPAEPATLTHGDLKCDNLIATGVGLRLLDLDRAAIAEPALDLGKFVADLSWWCASLGVDARQAISAFLRGYGPCDRVRLARMRDLAVLFQLKLAARRIPVHHPEWADQVVRAVGRAESAVAENAVAGGAW